MTKNRDRNRRPSVRAFERENDEGTYYLYDVYIYRTETWTGKMSYGRCLDVLIVNGWTEEKAKNRMMVARRRYRGKRDGTWKGDRH